MSDETVMVIANRDICKRFCAGCEAKGISPDDAVVWYMKACIKARSLKSFPVRYEAMDAHFLDSIDFRVPKPVYVGFFRLCQEIGENPISAIAGGLRDLVERYERSLIE